MGGSLRSGGRDGQTSSREYDAIVLAGGRGSRLGGVDKAALPVGGRTLLQRALDTVSGARRRIVVGPANVCGGRLPVDVVSTSESPGGGGPVAGIEAGMAYVEAPLVVVLACDMPFVDSATIRSLAAAVDDAEGALLVDEGGRRQPLAAVYDAAAMRRALSGVQPTRGAAARTLVSLLRLVEVAARPGQTADCDTWADVARAHEQLEDA